MKKTSYFLLAFCLMSTQLMQNSAATAAESDTYFESGSFGLLGALTEDMWKGGVIYESEKWEINLIGHYGSLQDEVIETHEILKGGYRKNLGHYNYLAFGLETQFHFGRSKGTVDLSKSYQLGPYVALQRYFSGSNLMMNLWVNPFQFDHACEEVNGAAVCGDNRRYFQTGGFGVSYMF